MCPLGYYQSANDLSGLASSNTILSKLIPPILLYRYFQDYNLVCNIRMQLMILIRLNFLYTSIKCKLIISKL